MAKPATTTVNSATINHPCQVRGPQPTPTLFGPNHDSCFATTSTFTPRIRMGRLGAAGQVSQGYCPRIS